MNQIGFNILRRAHENTKSTDDLQRFLRGKGLDLVQVKRHPEDYNDIIKEYSRHCINLSLFEESRERLQEEFNKLCEYHTRNERQLTDDFFNIAKQLILNSPDFSEDKQ